MPSGHRRCRTSLWQHRLRCDNIHRPTQPGVRSLDSTGSVDPLPVDLVSIRWSHVPSCRPEHRSRCLGVHHCGVRILHSGAMSQPSQPIPVTPARQQFTGGVPWPGKTPGRGPRTRRPPHFSRRIELVHLQGLTTGVPCDGYVAHHFWNADHHFATFWLFTSVGVHLFWRVLGGFWRDLRWPFYGDDRGAWAKIQQWRWVLRSPKCERQSVARLWGSRSQRIGAKDAVIPRGVKSAAPMAILRCTATRDTPVSLLRKPMWQSTPVILLRLWTHVIQTQAPRHMPRRINRCWHNLKTTPAVTCSTSEMGQVWLFLT